MRITNHNSSYTLSQQEISKLDIDIDILTGSEVLVYNHLLGMGNITNRLYLSQTYFAKQLGLCRATINRALKRLAELGLIQKIDRGWKEERTRIKKTCYYLVSRLFDLPEIRKRYAHKFKSLNYLKLITNFDQIIESGYKHCINIVTGIKSSLNSLFKNKEEGSLDYRGYRIRRRRQGIREGLKQEDSNLTIEEGSTMSEFISSLGGFNEEAKVYLTAFDESLVKEAIGCLGRKVPTGDQFTYFTKILFRLSREKNKEPNLEIINKIPSGKAKLQVPITSSSIIASSQPKTYGYKKEQEKKHIPTTMERMQRDQERRAIEEPTIQAKLQITALELAYQIADYKERSETNAFLREILGDTVRRLMNSGYRTTGEFNEDIAIAYLEKQKVKFNPEPTPVPVKDPSSNPTSLGNLINQVLPERPLQKGEILNNGAPLPERLEMLARAREKLGLPPKQEPSRPTTVMPVSPVAKALEDPTIREKVIMIKEAFPAMQITEVTNLNGEEEEFEPESATYNEVEYEEVLT